MFIENFNNKQQSIFLGLAKQLIASDGIITPTEEAMLAIMQSQMGAEITSVDANYEELLSIFDTKKSRASMMLELLGLAHADKNFHTSDSETFEKQFIQQVSKSCSISDAELNDMESWVVRQFALVSEANQFMGE